MGLPPPQNNNQEIQIGNQTKKLTFGWLNSKNQLCLSSTDVQKIQTKFSNIKVNRINNKGSLMKNIKNAKMEHNSRNENP